MGDSPAGPGKLETKVKPWPAVPLPTAEEVYGNLPPPARD